MAPASSSLHVQPEGGGADRPLGQLSLAYTGSSAGQEGGLWKPGYDCVCAYVCVVAFLVPADPAQCGGAAGVEMLWKLVAVISTSCLLCGAAGDVDWAFSPPPPTPPPPSSSLAWMVIWLRRLLISNTRGFMT